MKWIFFLSAVFLSTNAKALQIKTAPGCVLEITPDPTQHFDKVFTMRISSKTEPIVIQSVQWTMPEHGHGMTTKPVVQAVDAKNVDVKGIKLAMRGQWRLEVTGRCANQAFTSETTIRL
jgi:hypothetical protein